MVPGVAQLHQERFVKAAVFYGGAAWIYANAANYYYRFTQYGYNRDLTAFRQTLAWGAAWHGLALLDGWYYGRRYKPVKRTLFSDKPLKSPWGAALRSLFFPGWGQWYNDAPYKSAFYFTLTATIAYTVYHNDRLYRQTGAYSYKDQRTRYYWYLGLDYLLMVLDAQVDAWLYKFDEVTRWSLGPHPQNGALMFRMEVTF
ncbi:MAG: hypothetical protein D6677_10395 [Calditrichaeota bacterium]|nr:MAG: hypothetical protein D6677_10395 [Calditrichota bacterium]